MNNSPKSNSDFLNDLKQSKKLTVAQKLQIAQLEIELLKSNKEQKFWYRSFPIILSSVLALIASIGTFTQIWMASIQKDKELELSRIQKDKELELLKSDQEKKDKLDQGRFIHELEKELISKDKNVRYLAGKTLEATLPPEYAKALLSDIESQITSPEIKREIQTIRSNLPKTANQVNTAVDFSSLKTKPAPITSNQIKAEQALKVEQPSRISNEVVPGKLNNKNFIQMVITAPVDDLDWNPFKDSNNVIVTQETKRVFY